MCALRPQEQEDPPPEEGPCLDGGRVSVLTWVFRALSFSASGLSCFTAAGSSPVPLLLAAALPSKPGTSLSTPESTRVLSLLESLDLVTFFCSSTVLDLFLPLPTT